MDLLKGKHKTSRKHWINWTTLNIENFFTIKIEKEKVKRQSTHLEKIFTKYERNSYLQNI